MDCSRNNIKEACDILNIEFQGLQKVITMKHQSLWTDFDNLSTKDDENFHDLFTKVSGITKRS